MASQIVEINAVGAWKLFRVKLQNSHRVTNFVSVRKIKGGVRHGLKQDLYFCDGVRSPSQNRHKLSLNRAIIQLKQG